MRESIKCGLQFLKVTMSDLDAASLSREIQFARKANKKIGVTICNPGK